MPNEGTRQGRKPQVNAAHLLGLLREKHADDVFVDECKDGPTQSGSHRRLDAWAMNRSWSNACTTGYEIKVSRSDFLQDHKWVEYLGLCNAFYFVCPRGLIAVEECPAEAGLIWCATTGTRLFTKKKAPFRQVEIPESLWRYVLMCRSKITRENGSDMDPLDRWRMWLDRREERRLLGYAVGGRVRDLVQQAEQEVGEARRKVAMYEEVERLLDELGVGEYDRTKWGIRRAVQAAITGVAPGLVSALHDAHSDIENLIGKFAEAGVEMPTRVQRIAEGQR